MGWPPEFELNQKKILNLLTGERFYGGPGAAIREAFLNAIDACHRRQQRDSSSAYSPKIGVIFNRARQTVQISDNGDGMTREEISSLFASIGTSAADLASEGDSQVGEFGIGVVSYFLIAREFDIETVGEDGSPAGVTFSEDMFEGETTATLLEDPSRTERGTTLTLHLRNDIEIDSLIESYQKWVQDVPYADAREEPSGQEIPQGGPSVSPVEVNIGEKPGWIEEVTLGYGARLGERTRLPGSAQVDLLYRGVYVDSEEVNGLWGLRGSIHVDPKEFRPKLNREGFLKEDYEEKLESFLREVHPDILEESLEHISPSLDHTAPPSQQDHLITLFLGIPDNDQYDSVREKWLESFAEVPTLKELTSDGDRPLSFEELQEMEADRIYFAPERRPSSDTLLNQAVRVLRRTEEFVFTGVKGTTGYLRKAGLGKPSTSDLLEEVEGPLPDIVDVKEEKKEIIQNQQATDTLFPGTPEVKLVRLGGNSEPVIEIAGEIWINPDSEDGKQVLDHLLKEEPSVRGLLIAIQSVSLRDISTVASKLETLTEDDVRRMGPVRKIHLRRYLQ